MDIVKNFVFYKIRQMGVNAVLWRDCGYCAAESLVLCIALGAKIPQLEIRFLKQGFRSGAGAVARTPSTAVLTHRKEVSNEIQLFPRKCES